MRTVLLSFSGFPFVCYSLFILYDAIPALATAFVINAPTFGGRMEHTVLHSCLYLSTSCFS
ncbi:hypothetical protein BDV39DRAFT_165639 [Aspergillus sergii]|uniref:Uncharacterized protein n=1 Tax=Aspergillus sergii TaxID=1034303 RepID=A0A5N6XLV3_9EURO|nr:hypothetical protein BDV39DRAFT_165639 [Aspergillus sergii]